MVFPQKVVESSALLMVLGNLADEMEGTLVSALAALWKGDKPRAIDTVVP